MGGTFSPIQIVIPKPCRVNRMAKAGSRGRYLPAGEVDSFRGHHEKTRFRQSGYLMAPTVRIAMGRLPVAKVGGDIGVSAPVGRLM